MTFRFRFKVFVGSNSRKTMTMMTIITASQRMLVRGCQPSEVSRAAVSVFIPISVES